MKIKTIKRNPEKFNTSDENVKPVNTLTKDWKAGKLKSGWYFVECTCGEVTPSLWFDDEWDDFRGMVVEVLARVPSYEELQRLKKDAEQLDLFQTAVAEQSQQYGIVERENESLRLKVVKLAELLKESVCLLEDDIDFVSGEEALYIHDLLTRINAAIGESEDK